MYEIMWWNVTGEGKFWLGEVDEELLAREMAKTHTRYEMIERPSYWPDAHPDFYWETTEEWVDLSGRV